MFRKFVSLIAIAASISQVLSAPVRREVPQEHSHEKFLIATNTALKVNNPEGFLDAVFALLGNAAAGQSLGKTMKDPACLQQAIADQAFSNAKAANDLAGQTAALVFRTLERNSPTVGGKSDPCTSIQAVNPEIAALEQHQDPASAGAAALNKDITLRLAQQLAAIGADPLIAIESGTFAPGDLNDRTGRGNSCDDLGDNVGCIFTKNLLVPDATPEEVLAFVGGDAGGAVGGDAGGAVGDGEVVTPPPTNDAVEGVCPPPTTVTVTVGGATPTAGGAVQEPAPAIQTGETPAPATGNIQKFTGALGGLAAPAVTPGGRGLQVAGSDDFLNSGAALNRSCDIQKNQCANLANSAAGRQSGLKVSDCETQRTQCSAANA